MVKTCSSCGITKEASSTFFGKSPTNCGGLKGVCKVCINAANRLYKQNNKKKIKEHNEASWARLSTDATRLATRNEQKRAHYNANRPAVRTQQNNKYHNNPVFREAVRKRVSAYRKTTACSLNNTRSRLRRIANDPTYLMAERVRGMLSRLLGKRKDRLCVVLDYSLQDLIDHLNTGEYTYTMYLFDRGAYHIDHIIPLSYYRSRLSYDASGHLDTVGLSWARKANAIRNLRIIPAKANICKGDMLDMVLVGEHGIHDLL